MIITVKQKIILFFFLKVLKFYLKSLLILLLIKFSKKGFEKRLPKFYLSLYPNYYKDENELFLKKK